MSSRSTPAKADDGQGAKIPPEVNPDADKTRADENERIALDQAAELAELRAQLEAKDKIRDTEMERLRAQLGDRDRESGEVAELRAQLAAKASTAALNGDDEPDTFSLVLECGDEATAPNSVATHHYCDKHGTRRVRAAFPIEPAPLGV